MALVQAAAAAVWLAYVCCAGSPPARLDFRDILSGERMETCALAAAIGILAYGVHIDQIGTWIPQKTGVKDSEKSES
ncbi:hypothetical protein DFH09DRAFT_1147221 [Mycena vulgaris]|nr:hypothetical protein DFH09DRAFT_1147221 [Mycena vulgaris]